MFKKEEYLGEIGTNLNCFVKKIECRVSKIGQCRVLSLVFEWISCIFLKLGIGFAWFGTRLYRKSYLKLDI